jgi:hypothetical protein
VIFYNAIFNHVVIADDAVSTEEQQLGLLCFLGFKFLYYIMQTHDDDSIKQLQVFFYKTTTASASSFATQLARYKTKIPPAAAAAAPEHGCVASNLPSAHSFRVFVKAGSRLWLPQNNDIRGT